MNDQINTIKIYFSSGREEQFELGTYFVELNAAGMFIKERLPNKSGIVTPVEDSRTVMYINMSNIDYLKFGYVDGTEEVKTGTELLN